MDASLWRRLWADPVYRCPRCTQPLPKRWWRKTERGHFSCRCGAQITPRVNAIWEWPLIVVWGGASGMLFELKDFDLWTAVSIGALSGALLLCICRFMFCQPQRA